MCIGKGLKDARTIFSLINADYGRNAGRKSDERRLALQLWRKAKPQIVKACGKVLWYVLLCRPQDVFILSACLAWSLYQRNYRAALASVAGKAPILCAEVFGFALLLGEISGSSNLVRVQLLFSIYFVHRAAFRPYFPALLVTLLPKVSAL